MPVFKDEKREVMESNNEIIKQLPDVTSRSQLQNLSNNFRANIDKLKELGAMSIAIDAQTRRFDLGLDSLVRDKPELGNVDEFRFKTNDERRKERVNALIDMVPSGSQFTSLNQCTAIIDKIPQAKDETELKKLTDQYAEAFPKLDNDTMRMINRLKFTSSVRNWMKAHDPEFSQKVEQFNASTNIKERDTLAADLNQRLEPFGGEYLNHFSALPSHMSLR